MIRVTTIPAGWSYQTLNEVCVKIQDGTHFSPRPGGRDYRYITSRNIGNGRLRLDAVEMISEAEHRKIYRRCDALRGDLLLTKDGANTGNAAINSFADEISLLSSVALIRANKRKALETYILQYLLSGPGRKQIVDAMAGNAITRLTLAKIKALQVPLPDTEEQRRIAVALADADDLIGTLERLIAKKQAIKQGMMQQLLTGRTRLPDFTEPWRTETLGDLENKGELRLFRGKVISKLDIAAFPGAYPIYSSSVHNDGLFGTYGRYMFDEELITWSVDGGGHFFYRPPHKFSVTNVCGYMRVLSNSIDVRFLAYQLQALHAQLHFDYTLKAHPSVIRGAYHMMLPTTGEQRAIARAIGDIDDEIGALKMRLGKARAIKAGMMQQLLTGRTRLPTEAAS